MDGLVKDGSEEQIVMRCPTSEKSFFANESIAVNHGDLRFERREEKLKSDLNLAEIVLLFFDQLLLLRVEDIVRQSLN